MRSPQSYKWPNWYQDKNPPDKTPPDINPRTKTPLDKTPPCQAGHQPEPQRRRYQDSNRRIKNIVQDYHNMDRLQYLRGLAHNISMS